MYAAYRHLDLYALKSLFHCINAESTAPQAQTGRCSASICHDT